MHENTLEKMSLVFDEVAFRVALARAGYRTIASFARQIGLSTPYCTQIARGVRPSVEKRSLIAAALGVEVDTLWRVLP